MAKSSLIGRIAIDMVAYTGKLLAPIKKAQAAITGLAAKARSVGGAFMRFAAPVTAMVSGVLSIYYAISKLTKAFEEVGNLADESARLGIPAEQLAGLQYAALQSGMTIESLGTALQYMLRQGRNVSDLSRIADELERIRDPAARMQRTISLFGRSGAGMINMLAGGSAALGVTIAQAQRLGIVLNTMDANAVEAAGDALQRIGLVIDGIARQVAVALSPLIIKAADDMVAWGTSGEGMASKVRGAIDSIIDAVGRVADFIQKSIVVWKYAQAMAGIVVLSIAQLLGGLVHAAEAAAEGIANAFIWCWNQTKIVTQYALSWMVNQIADIVSDIDALLPAAFRTGLGEQAQAIAAAQAEIARSTRAAFEGSNWQVDLDFGTEGIDSFVNHFGDTVQEMWNDTLNAQMNARDNPWSAQIQRWVDEARGAAAPGEKLRAPGETATGPAPSVGALERGSSAAMSAIVATQKTLNLEQQQLEAQRSMRTLLERIESNTRQQLAPAGLA